jgi:hypothetical protein
MTCENCGGTGFAIVEREGREFAECGGRMCQQHRQRDASPKFLV